VDYLGSLCAFSLSIRFIPLGVCGRFDIQKPWPVEGSERIKKSGPFQRKATVCREQRASKSFINFANNEFDQFVRPSIRVKFMGKKINPVRLLTPVHAVQSNSPQ
jgi:hypothetical protein